MHGSAVRNLKKSGGKPNSLENGQKYKKNLDRLIDLVIFSCLFIGFFKVHRI